MTDKEMKKACLEADEAIIGLIYKYEMNDDEIEVFYHTIAKGLLTSTTVWARERWLER